LFYKGKHIDVSNIKQKEDKYERFDYGKVRVDYSSLIVGENENIKDSR
jgi:hypothetical protein